MKDWKNWVLTFLFLTIFVIEAIIFKNNDHLENKDFEIMIIFLWFAGHMFLAIQQTQWSRLNNGYKSLQERITELLESRKKAEGPREIWVRIHVNKTLPSDYGLFAIVQVNNPMQTMQKEKISATYLEAVAENHRYAFVHNLQDVPKNILGAPEWQWVDRDKKQIIMLGVIYNVPDMLMYK